MSDLRKQAEAAERRLREIPESSLGPAARLVLGKPRLTPLEAAEAENARLSALLAAALSPEGIDRAARALATVEGYGWAREDYVHMAERALRAALTPPGTSDA